MSDFRRCFGPNLAVLFVLLSLSTTQSCAQELTPAQKQVVTDLKGDLARVRKDIEDAERENQRFAGGLVKSLIAVRLEVLKTNAALIEQRLHTIEGGAKTVVVINSVKSDPQRAVVLAKEIESQKEKVAAARAGADRYGGGLVQALAETTFVTAGNTLAMMEQQYFVAKYGIAMPAPREGGNDGKATPNPVPAVASARASTPAATASETVTGCLKIQTFDSSVLSTNSVYTELAWKVDVANSCATPFTVRAIFKIFDKDDFELDSGFQDV